MRIYQIEQGAEEEAPPSLTKEEAEKIKAFPDVRIYQVETPTTPKSVIL